MSNPTQSTGAQSLANLIHVGAMMANCMFNYAQRGGSLTAEERANFGALCKAWDAARSAMNAEPAQLGGLTDDEAAIRLWNNIADGWNDWSNLGGDEKDRIINAVRDLRAVLSQAVPTNKESLTVQEWLTPNQIREKISNGEYGAELMLQHAMHWIETQVAPVRQAGQVPWWKLVPIEPTPGMIAAAFVGTISVQCIAAQLRARVLMAENYRKMIAAAPQPGEPDQSAWTVSHNGKTVTAETLSKAMVAARGLRSEAETAIAAQNLMRAIEEELATSEFLGADDMQALRRFDECCEDSDSGGHDVPKGAMRRLAEIGVVRSIGFGHHEMTAFGRHVLEIHAGEQATLPLTTYQDACAIAAGERSVVHPDPA